MASTERFEDVSPIDEEVIADVARGGAAEARAAVAAARDAFDGWRRTVPKERAEILHRIADGVEARVADLAAVETRDNGSLLRSHLRSVMPRVARNFRFFADRLLALDGSADAAYDGNAEHVTWDPAGVTVVISLERAPDARDVADRARAGGREHHDPEAPRMGSPHRVALADIARDAGLPDGVFNVVQGIGEEAGAALTSDPGVARIAFTGSVDTGRLVAEAAAANLTPVSLSSVASRRSRSSPTPTPTQCSGRR